MFAGGVQMNSGKEPVELENLNSVLDRLSAFLIQFDRLSVSCRGQSLARILSWAADFRGLGGPVDVRRSLGDGKRGDDACGVRCEGVSNSSSTSTAARQPTLSDLPGAESRGEFLSPMGGRTSGRRWTVEGALERETLQHWPPKAGTYFRPRKDRVNGSTLPVRSGRWADYSSRLTCSAQSGDR